MEPDDHGHLDFSRRTAAVIELAHEIPIATEAKGGSIDFLGRPWAVQDVISVAERAGRGSARRARPKPSLSLDLDVRRELSKPPEDFLAEFFPLPIPIGTCGHEAAGRLFGIGPGIKAFA